MVSRSRQLAEVPGPDGASYVPFADPVAPAYLKTVSDILSGLPVSITRFMPPEKILGIVSRTNTDDLQPYFADALAAEMNGVKLRELVCTPGLFNLDSSIAMSTPSQLLRGSGIQATEIRIRSTTASAITLANGVAGYGLEGLAITRQGVPVAGADGVKFLGTTDRSSLKELKIEGHWNLLVIGTTDRSRLRDLELRKAYNDGISQTNSAAYGPSQWNCRDILLERIKRDGWRVQVTDGPAGLILGGMSDIHGFGIGGWGINLLGSATTGIYDLRLLGDNFIGSCGLGSLNLDTYGTNHRVSIFAERNGMDVTGPNLEDAASGVGVGMNVAGSNADVNVFGSKIDKNAYDGIVHAGAILSVGTSHIVDNGQAGVAGRRNGILSYSGRLIAGGDVIRNMGAGTSQLYGIAAGHDDVIIVGDDLLGNATAATSLGGTVDAVQIGNAGTAIHRLPSGTGLNVGDATGGTAAGVVNVATNVTKNGTVYANP